MTKIRQIITEMTTKQILVYVDKVTKPYALSIKSDSGKSYMRKHLNDCDELVKLKNKYTYTYDQKFQNRSRNQPTYAWVRIRAT